MAAGAHGGGSDGGRAAVRIEASCDVVATPRVEQVRGIFDLTAEKSSRVSWEVALPLDERPWNVGLIVGPSGCGKSTIARHLWPGHVDQANAAEASMPLDLCVLDAFPAEMSVKDVIELLCSVGFSSPPAWLRPYRVLSTGQRFRALLAVLLSSHPFVVFDEFTSVVDRTVAQIGSAALAKTVRARGTRFVAVTCHEDVEAWLQPDWVYRPAENVFAWRLLQRRPEIRLSVFRCEASAWPLFRGHHYLSDYLVLGGWYFLATWHERPVCFSAWVANFSRGPKGRREHRTVCLPDYQGVGIGNAVSNCIASMWRGLGLRAVSTTTHPAMVRSRCKSPLWILKRAPGMTGSVKDAYRHAVTRMTAGFEYVGPAMDPRVARMLLEG